MGETRGTTPSGDDSELEREIRAGRKFSLSEAIGQMAGGGLMKGASRISRYRQAELTIEDYLRRHLTDTPGVLGRVLLRHVAVSDDPLLALTDCVRRVLGSQHLLDDVVREADVEWGQVFQERPHFAQPGKEPQPDDPYTIESVRIVLCEGLERLARRQ